MGTPASGESVPDKESRQSQRAQHVNPLALKSELWVIERFTGVHRTGTAQAYLSCLLCSPFGPGDLAVEPCKVLLPLRIAGRDGDKRGHDITPLAAGCQCLRGIA
jgi:hypothetical protein